MDSITTQIVEQELATALNVRRLAIDPALNFASHGGDSITAVKFSAACKRLGVLVGVDHVMASSSIGELLRLCRPIFIGADTTATSQPVHCYQARTKDLHFSEHDIKHVDHDFTVPSFLPPGGISSSNLALLPAPSPWAHTNGDGKLSLSTSVSKSSVSLPGGLLPAGPEDELSLLHSESQGLGNPNDASERLTDLAGSQISLIHGSLDVPGTNVIHHYETYHPSQIPQIKSAWKLVLDTEPVFCAVYRNPEDECAIIPRLHWREYTTSSVHTYNDALSTREPGVASWPDAYEGIDLGVRFTVIHLHREMESRSTIIWSLHHALIDGWSASQVLLKVRQVASGLSVQPSTPFTDVVAALGQLRAERKAEGDEFWAEQRECIAAAKDELLLPAPPFSSHSKSTMDEIRISLGSHYNILKSVARAAGVTPATVFHAAWAVMLGIYADSDSVLFSIVVSMRNLPIHGALDAVGPLVNTLPFTVDISWSSSMHSFFKDVFERMQRVAKYSWTAPPEDVSRSRGSMVALQLAPQPEEQIGISPIGHSFTRQTTNLPLSAILGDDGDISLQYSSVRYDRGHIQAFATSLEDLLKGLPHHDSPLQSWAARLMSTSTVSMLRANGNCESLTTTRVSISNDLVTLFETAASCNPHNVAIQHAGRSVTYADLLRLSTRVASVLAKLIGPEEVVAVHADASVNWLIAIYGVLRAGGTYCPVDAAHTQSHRDALVESSGARCFVATTTEALNVSPQTVLHAIDIQAIVEAELAREPELALRHEPRPWEMAYLCFTSGSSGKPKGVQCTHQGLVAFQSDLEVRLFASPGRRIAQTMSVAFDGSIHELFSALSYGATLVLRPEGDSFAVLKTVDSAILTPSVASLLDPQDFPKLKALYLVGEAVPQNVCDTWSASKALYNMYGPTEGTCGATVKRLLPYRPVTIGGPNPSTRIYILSHRRQFVPPGVVGELYLAGVQVAKGYIGQPALTRERFFPDTICSGLGEYMYKTGDRGYWNEAGDIVFQGRVDRQIKLRGFRVDLEDLEARIIRACEEARAVAMTLKDDDLVCMIQTAAVDIARLRACIVDVVPAFAMPKYILAGEKLPMTATGKIDYRAIAKLATTPLQSNEGFETQTETTLAAAWIRVLNLDPRDATISPQSNFSAMGGHSLQQLRLAARLTAAFGVRVTVGMVSGLPSLRDLASAIDLMAPKTDVSLRHHQDYEVGHCDPSPMEKEWWQKYALEVSSSAFNVSYVSRFDPNIVDRQRLIDAWNVVLARHWILRSRFVYHRTRGLERVLDSDPPRVEKLSSVNVWLELNRPFDLADSPPVRVFFTDEMIVGIWSHIICDYTTLGLMLTDVAAVYRCRPLSPAVQPSCNRAAEDTFAPPCYLSFWSNYLEGVEAQNPSYLGNGANRTSYRGTSSVAQISIPVWRLMQAHAAHSDVTLQQFALGATALALSAVDDDMDITLGMPYMNRQTEVEMHAVGLFLEPLPVRIAFDSAPEHASSSPTPSDNSDSTTSHQPTPHSAATYLSAVQNASQQSLSHAVSWHQLLEHLKIDPQQQFPNHPLFDCVVSFHDCRPNTALSAADEQYAGPWSIFNLGAGVEPQFVWSEGAKFKLMVEFTAVNETTLLLRLEYDNTCFPKPGHIAAVRRMILRAVETMISTDPNTLSFSDVRRILREAWTADEASAFKGEQTIIDDVRLLDGSREDFFQVPFTAF